MVTHLGLYLHIPFCRHRCPYCDFTTYAGKEALIPDYLKALIRELNLWGRALAVEGSRGRVSTVYFGGGTPSLLSSEQVGQTLEACRGAFDLDEDAEVSLEANPGTVSPQGLLDLRRRGVNRLSLGVQGFDDGLLRTLERLHDSAQAREAFHWARGAGFDNINLDLIYGLPGQTLTHWRADLEEALSLAPEHLSLYALTVEEGTSWGEAVASGQMAVPDADLAADMYLGAEERLATAGYHHYEISNWARPGRECRHNLTYWERRSYLGLGAGAHSFRDGCRFANTSGVEDYMAALERTPFPPPTPREVAEWGPVTQVEVLSPTEELAETLILGLRLSWGVDLAQLPHQWKPYLDALGHAIEELAGWGLLERAGSRLRLTPRGRLLSNEVFYRLLPSGVYKLRSGE